MWIYVVGCALVNLAIIGLWLWYVNSKREGGREKGKRDYHEDDV